MQVTHLGQSLKYVSLLAMVAATGCASVIEGGDQTINVSTTGCEEHGVIQCSAVNDDGSSQLTAPASVSVDKDMDDLTISCRSKDKVAHGEVIVESTYEAWNAGNILLGGVIGVGVDAATGAMWNYPSSVIVPMKCPESAPSSIVKNVSQTGLHGAQVGEIASAMECNAGRSLLKSDGQKEQWLLSCGDNESLEVQCNDGVCVLI